MSKTIKRGLVEIHQYDENDVPIILYPNVKKYKNVPFLVNKHRDLEVLFVRNGKIEMHLDNAVFEASTGDIVVVNCNVLHNIVPIDEAVYYDCILINKDFCRRYGFQIEKEHIQEVITDPKVFAYIDEIKPLMDEEHSEYRVAGVAVQLLQLLLRLFEKYAMPLKEQGSYNREMLEKGLEYIHEHFNEQIDVDAVADYSGYSKYYFCRRFKELTGCTVNTYINMQRVSRAKELLSCPGMRVNDVAAECGFNNVPYFSQIFKKYVRRSPSEYRKRKKSQPS